MLTWEPPFKKILGLFWEIHKFTSTLRVLKSRVKKAVGVPLVDVGSIPGITQWPEDPVLPQASSVTDVAQIWCCCGCDVDLQLQLRFHP